MAARLRHRADPTGGPGSLSRRTIWLGVVAVGAYLGLALVSMRATGGAVRPLYDGLAPPVPYRWINAPKEFSAGNRPPESGTAEVPLDPDGSNPGQARTGDGQAQLVLPAGVFPTSEGQTGVRIVITPLDPETVAKPPNGEAFQGNAYRFGASYVPSRTPAAPVREANILLRYPATATRLLRFTGSAWQEVPAQNITASLQLLANSRDLGTFVAVAPSLHSRTRGFLLIAVTGGAAIAALALGLYLRSRAARRRR